MAGRGSPVFRRSNDLLRERGTKYGGCAIIYGPKGYVISKAIADPHRTAEEFYNAYRVATTTDQWNWGFGAFTTASTMADEKVQVETVDVSLGSDNDPPFEDPAILEYPHYADPNDTPSELWFVPWNSSYLEVGDGDMAISWTSEYPELVVSNFSFQYVRATLGSLGSGIFGNPRMPRLRLQMQVDGIVIPGSGPYSKAERTATRGSGSQEHTIAQAVTFVQMLPAGEHRITPVACLGPSVFSSRASDEGAYNYIVDESSVLDYVAFGNRRHTVIRFAKGAWLGT